MVTKGIITSVPESADSNVYKVRLPFFEDPIENAEEMIYESLLNESPGILQGYDVGDVVYCAFEDNNMARPVIIGKLFSTSLENMSAEIQTLDLDVTNRASLPKHTTIGSATEDDIAKIPEIKNKVNKMGDTIFGGMTFGNNVEYTSKKKINIIDNSGNTIMSELTDHLFADSMTRQCSSGTNGSGDTVGYIHLCDITLTKHYQARFIDFRIYVGDGNNGKTNQNAYIELLLQSGWIDDLNTAGRLGGYWELHKLGTSLTVDKFDIIVTSDSNLQYSVWLYVNGVGYCKPTYTVWYDRELLNDPTNICTITHVGNVRQTTVPTGTDPDCLIGHGISTNVDHATSADHALSADSATTATTATSATNATNATNATKDGDGNTITSYYCTLSTAQTISGAKEFSSEVKMTASGAVTDICQNVVAAFKTNRAQITELITNDIYTGGTSNQNPITFNKYTGVDSGTHTPTGKTQLAKIDTDGNIYEGSTKLSSKYLTLSGGTVTGTLTLSRNQDASGDVDNKPALIVGGASTAQHIEMDGNEILSKENGTTPSILWLQDSSGTVKIGGTGGLIIDATNSDTGFRCRNISYGQSAPSGGSDGDIYIQYTN